jgi:hypothetical protein
MVCGHSMRENRVVVLRLVPVCLLLGCTSPELVAFTPAAERSVEMSERVRIYVEYSPADVEVTVDGKTLMTGWGMSDKHCYEDLCEVDALWDTTDSPEGEHEIAVKLDGEVADTHTVSLVDAFMVSTFAVSTPLTGPWSVSVLAVAEDNNEVLGCVHQNGAYDTTANTVFELGTREDYGSRPGIFYPLEGRTDPAIKLGGSGLLALPLTTVDVGGRAIRVELWSDDYSSNTCERGKPSAHMYGASAARTIADWRMATTPESFGEVGTFTTDFARIGTFDENDPDAPCVECGGCSTTAGGSVGWFAFAIVAPLVPLRRRRRTSRAAA